MLSELAGAEGSILTEGRLAAPALHAARRVWALNSNRVSLRTFEVFPPSGFPPLRDRASCWLTYYSPTFEGFLAVNAMALCLVFLLAKRCGETAGADKVSTKLSAITAENKGLKDNLMKVYSMLQEKQQQPPQMATMPPPPARQIPVEKQAADEVDVKPYA